MERSNDDEDEPRAPDPMSARVEDQLREARSEVFRAYVRVQQQTEGLPDGTEEEAGPPPDAR